MTGTFGGALEARDIPAGDGRLQSTAVGEIELEDRTLAIKRIHITYHLQVDADADEQAVDRAFRHHPSRCPVHRSIHPQIEITTELDLST